MKTYSFYRKVDKSRECLSITKASSRYEAALFFANRKNLSLKEFLLIYTITR